MKITAMRFRDMLKRKDFFITLTVSTLLFLIPAFLDLLLLYRSEVSSLRPPWYYFGLSLSPGIIYDSPLVIQFAFLLIIPLLSCMAYSYCCLDESKFGIKNIIISKVSRARYYLSSALTVFLGGFLVIFIPMVLSQLVFLVAVPFTAYAPIDFSSPAYQDNAFRNIKYFTFLANNHHYLYNLLFCFIPSFVCALIGLLSFSFSFVFKKNRYLVVTLPFILYIIFNFILEMLGKTNWVLAYIIMPSYSKTGMKLSHLIIVILGLLFVNICSLVYKILFKKDEL